MRRHLGRNGEEEASRAWHTLLVQGTEATRLPTLLGEYRDDVTGQSFPPDLTREAQMEQPRCLEEGSVVVGSTVRSSAVLKRQ